MMKIGPRPAPDPLASCAVQATLAAWTPAAAAYCSPSRRSPALASTMAGALRHDGQQPVERWFEADYWRALVPASCTISDVGPSSVSDPTQTNAAALAPLVLPEPLIEELQQRMTTDGYFELGKEALATAGSAYDTYAAVVERLGIGVRALVAKGWPASFIILFDEAWQLVQLLGRVMRATTGGNECMMDLVAWHIDPSVEEAGFTPHRDRSLGLQELDTAEVAAGFRQPGGASPRDGTCWIALSDASCDNGCLYVVPRSADPAYALGDCSAAASPTGCPLPPGTFRLQQGPVGEP